MTEERRSSASTTPTPAVRLRDQDRRERELSVYSEIAHALATAEDEREIIQLVLDRLHMLLPGELAAIVLVETTSPELVVSALRSSRRSEEMAERRFGREGTVVDRALRDARPVSIRRGTSGDPILSWLLGGDASGPGVAVPIRGPGGAPLGCLLVLNTADHPDPADLRLLITLADKAAIAIHRQRVRESSTTDAIRLKILGAVIQASGAGLDESALVRSAVDVLIAALPADAVEVLLRDGGELQLVHSYPSLSVRSGDAVATSALHLRTVDLGEPTIVDAGDAADRATHQACFPLQAGDRTLGSFLIARNSRPFDVQEIELLTAVGQHLGIAIEFGRLFRRAALDADALERVVAERSSALQATQDQLARSQWLASLGEIAAGVAHDLNNALNPIVAFAELIKEHRDQPDKVRTYAERILMAAQGGAETVRRIQRFTRRHLGTMPFEALSLASLVRDAVELIRPMLRGSGESIEVVEAVDADVLVNANAGELRQALLNLIKNAVDAMPAGGTLRFVGRVVEDSVLIAVQDTGTGMPSDVVDRALEPFYTTKGAHGTGLGLAEVFGIVRRHGGALELESWPGVGTTVLLRFPAAAAADRPAVPRGPRARARKHFRILVVDDNVLGLEATAASLRAAGHTVVTAPNAESALRLFQRAKYDVILSDLGLPDMNGWDLVDRFRRQDEDVRIGVITGWSVPENDEELQRRGVEVVLTKPVDPEHLLDLL